MQVFIYLLLSLPTGRYILHIVLSFLQV